MSSSVSCSIRLSMAATARQRRQRDRLRAGTRRRVSRPTSRWPTIRSQGAAASRRPFEQRWTAWGAAYGGSSTTNGDPVVGSTDVTARHLRLRRRHGLSCHARHRARLRARRRRHQLGSGAGSRQRPERCVPGRHLRHDAFRAGLSRRRARIRQSLDDDRPHRAARRSAHREL